MLFGEKYAQNVRVVNFGEDSCELCGGIHVESSGLLGSFIITKESGVSSGVRRIEAICGNAAYRAYVELEKERESLEGILKSKDLIAAVNKLKDKNKELEKSLQTRQNNVDLKPLDINGIKVIIQYVEGEIKMLVDEAKNRYEKVAILLINEKLNIVAGSKNNALKAGGWAKEVALALGGNGGGRDDFATAGGKDKDRLDLALKLALEIAQKSLG